MRENYIKIIESICVINGVNENELIEILRKRDNIYLLLLMVKRYNCFNKKEIMNLLKVDSTRSVNYNLRKAEEKFLINREFRDKYMKIEKNIEKII